MPTAVPVSSRSASGSRRLSTRFAMACCAAMRLLSRWQARHRQRLDLGELDDRLLDDIGVTRKQAEEERCKPFWR